MADEDVDPASRTKELEPRPPEENDLVAVCGRLNELDAKYVVIREVQGVPIPFASPRLLWRMKKPTMREKDAGDLAFLREYFRQAGEEPPEIG